MVNLKLFLWLKLWFLTVLCSSHISSSASDTFFINCGSPTNVTVNNRTFESDNNLGREIFDSTRGISVRTTTDSNSGDESTLFETARVFSDESSSYRFPIQKHGWFLIRLYFLPFVSASRDLTTARFSISAQNFNLIRDYKPSKTSVVKEYSLNISSDNLVLEFRPETGSVAFINALEVFRLPESLLPEEAKLIGTQKNLKLMTHAMETVSRVNMGNLSVSRDQDKLWRQWDSDFTYKVHFGTPVKNLEAVNFSAGGITDDTAPVYVYGTATRLNSDLDPNTNANLTWTFKIDPGFDYFVRFHFCNIIVDPFVSVRRISFDIFLNSEKVESIDMTEVANGTFGAPYYVDAVMQKAKSREGDLYLSVGGVLDVTYPVSFINGFEILKLSNDKRSLDVSDAVFPNSSSRNKSSNPGIGLIAGLSAALSVAIVFCVVMFSWCIRKRRIRNRQMQTVHSRGDEQIKKSETGESLILSSSKIGYRYPLALIKEATDDFDESLVIGVGGFGKVYKGVLRDKTEIAVKRGATQSRQGLAEFKTEIEMLSQFRHRHLVSLIGYCDENNEMIIVYEYMAKGTLKDHLYDSNDNPRLSWKQRLEICVGAARGLHYLHTGSARAIIHRDVKSANILLDENFMAKVADFGLSKIGPDLDQTHVSTAVKGSFGYLDPEYLTRQQLTEKSDVYSFGVVMLEVLCGRPVIDPSLPREKVNLIDWATKLLKKGKMEEIVDPFLDGKVKLEEVMKYCDITEKCLAADGIERPTMGDLLWNLEFMLEVQAKEEKAAMVDDKIEASVVGSTMQFSVNGVGDIAGVSMSKVFAQMVREETR